MPLIFGATEFQYLMELALSIFESGFGVSSSDIGGSLRVSQMVPVGLSFQLRRGGFRNDVE
jgi:hypothetical protein